MEKNGEDFKGSFRLIGIRPHTGCHIKFTKVLKPGKLYQFYNEYRFYRENGYEVNDGENITNYSTNKSTVPKDLFSIENININISAIVGKNGSGKSTLIEMLLYCVYLLGTALKDEKGKRILIPYHEQILGDYKYNNKRIEAYEEKKNKLYKDVETLSNNQDTTPSKTAIDKFKRKLNDILNLDFEIKELINNKKIWENNIADSKVEHKFITDYFKCSIYYEIDGLVWEYNTATNSYISIPNIVLDENENYKAGIVKTLSVTQRDNYKMLSNFFYTMMLNYSHHALNSGHIGFWVTTLFHKNDGYKTPAVINPMRTDGNFNINTENNLAKDRLLMNLLIEALHHKQSPRNIKLTDKQYVYKVRFTLDELKVEREKITLGNYGSNDENENFIISGPIDDVNIIKELLPLYFQGTFDEVIVQNKNLPYANSVINYLTIKIPKALKNYPQYDSYLEHDNQLDYLREVLPRLKEDKSHVTFKIERALFYLKKLLDSSSVAFWGSSKKHVDFNLYELLDWMDIKSLDDIHLVSERIPPSIFNIDFLLDSEQNITSYSGEEIENLPTLQALSSGEQHKIHIINGVVYHINNIFSVHNSDSALNRLMYNYINIIFDEIELYFHPDLQREFIFDLLENIKRLTYITKDPSNRIKGLNFIFSTHSPFILSDIPVQNILKIEYDSITNYSNQISDSNQTFGANIHDLLTNSFFFKNKAFVGKHANTFLKELINTITEYRKNNITISSDDVPDLLKKASLIGEPFFREKLIEMIMMQSEISAKEKIEILIKKKKKEIEDLENRVNSSENDTDKP